MTIAPQLLTDCKDPDALFACDGFAAEEKMDGDRCFVCKAGNVVTATSRAGQPMRLTDETIAMAMLGGERFVIDGEMMPGGEFVAFDILSHGALNCIGWANAARAELLRAISPFRVVERATGLTGKLELFFRVKGEKGEGIVFKALNATYEGGRSESYQRHKNYESDDFTVTAVDMADCSVFVSLDGEPCGKVQSSFYRLPRVGDKVRVRYEKRTANGKLLRARILSKVII